jgi:hypothetical protein
MVVERARFCLDFFIAKNAVEKSTAFEFVLLSETFRTHGQMFVESIMSKKLQRQGLRRRFRRAEAHMLVAPQQEIRIRRNLNGLAKMASSDFKSASSADDLLMMRQSTRGIAMPFHSRSTDNTGVVVVFSFLVVQCFQEFTRSQLFFNEKCGRKSRWKLQ